MKSLSAKTWIVTLVMSSLSMTANATGFTTALTELDSDYPTADDRVEVAVLNISSAPSYISSSTPDNSPVDKFGPGKLKRIYREASPEAAKAILNLHQGLPVYTNVNSGLLFQAAGLCGQQKKIKEFKNDASALACIIEMNAKLNR